MSLLDDARRLNKCGPEDNDRGWLGQDCHFCSGILDAGGDQWPATGHRPDCPWLSMPKIVAVLEAADRLTDDEPVYYDEAHHRVECLSCGATAPGHGPLEAHEPDCAHQALVAALRGEVTA